MKLRWSLVLLAWAFLVGPTPGAVGSCEDEDLSEPVEFSYYCRNREELHCVREFLRKNITERERDKCRWDAQDSCRRRTFPSDCQPTKRTAEGCLNALRSLDTLDMKDGEIEECDTELLCGATPGENPDGGDVVR